jgi:hypothetical protein
MLSTQSRRYRLRRHLSDYGKLGHKNDIRSGIVTGLGLPGQNNRISYGSGPAQILARGILSLNWG